MNEHIENYKINLNQVVDLITRLPYFEVDQTGKYKLPPFTEKSILGLASYFGHFNEHIIKEADKPENGNAFKKSVANSFYPIIKKYVKWYIQNSNEIEDKFGKDNMYSATHRIIEMTENTIVEYLGVKALSKKDEVQYSFKSLFKDEEHYNKAKNILIANHYIKQGNKSLEWIFTSTVKYTANQTIIALCVVLEKKGYFKENIKSIYTYIHNEFNIKIDKGNYSRSAKGFKEDYNKSKTTNYSYTSLFNNIL